MSKKLILSRFASITGDASGTVTNINANGNYAGSPTIFKITAAPGEHIELQRMIITVEDANLNSFDVYGGAGTLTVGITVFVTDVKGNIVYYLTDPRQPITNMGEWAHYCFDAQILNATSGEDHFVARWTFAKAGIPVTLYPGWSLNILCEDDLRALTEHHFLVQGRYLDDSTAGAAYG